VREGDVRGGHDTCDEVVRHGCMTRATPGNTRLSLGLRRVGHGAAGPATGRAGPASGPRHRLAWGGRWARKKGNGGSQRWGLGPKP
jgi:hypothetical protein